MKDSFWYKLLMPFLVLMLTVSVTVSCNGVEGQQEEEEEEEQSTEIVDPIMTDAGLVSGTVVGDVGEEVRVYKGIPFAAPPVGDLRWKPPQPVEPWDGVLDCTEFAPIAPQITSSEVEQSEDCLYLNVYTPATNTTDLLPVFVSIHGGAMVIGSSRSPDMTYFAQQNDVVGVSIAYRLGGLGFFAHPLLSEESENGVSGNYGLMDQVAALEWVQNNIAAFGGDPDNVTIQGCSSGGESVLFLMASPFSEGLLHQAIADAGVYGSSRTPPLEEMETRGENLAIELGVADEPDVLAALRALGADEIVAAVPVSTSGTELQLPNVDGWFLPDLPLEVFQAGNQQNVPLMIGSGSDDLAKEWNQYGDKNFACAMSTVSSEVYAWIFDHAPCGSGGGTHCLDLTYLFADLSTREDMCDVDLEVSEAMVAMWVQFARTGDPNVEGLIEWPTYEEATDQYLKIGDPVEVKTGLYIPPEAGEEEEETPAEPATYTNTEYGFSLEYPGDWVEKTEDLDVTINDTDFTQAEVTYSSTAYDYESVIIGLVTDGKWIIIEVYTVSILPFDYEDQQAEILSTVTFE